MVAIASCANGTLEPRQFAQSYEPGAADMPEPGYGLEYEDGGLEL